MRRRRKRKGGRGVKEETNEEGKKEGRGRRKEIMRKMGKGRRGNGVSFFMNG